MLKALFFMLAVGGGCAVFAQAVQPMPPQRDASTETTLAEMANAKKRMELRNVLSAGRKAEPTAKPAPATQAEQAGRQLSRQQRAEMREQLRRYQPAGVSRVQRP